MGIPIATLIALSLLQCIAAEPRPEFALSVSVRGTSRVGDAGTEAQSIIDLLTKNTKSFTFKYNLKFLTDVFTPVKTIATDYQPLATAVVTSITTLSSDSSGNVDAVYGAALEAVNKAIAYATDPLPALGNSLKTLVGDQLQQKFKDSFEHIEKALLVIKTTLTELQSGANKALTDAGAGGTITSYILSKNLPRSAITALVKGLHLLQANVPVLTYTVDSTIEGLGIADQYMQDLSAKVTSTLGEKSGVAADLDSIITETDTTISKSLSSVATDIGKIQNDLAQLANVATAASASKVTKALGDFLANKSELEAKTPTIKTVLETLKQAVLDVYAIAAPLFLIDESFVVDALINTLISNAEYSQYCFYKYKDLFFTLLDMVSVSARECIDTEVARLEYFRVTVGLMLDLLSFDYMDIGDDLTVCNGISDTTNLEECIASLSGIYTKLELAFGDMFTFLYDSVSREVKASSNRLKICLRMSQQALGNDELPTLLGKITDCAQDGPAGEDE